MARLFCTLSFVFKVIPLLGPVEKACCYVLKTNADSRRGGAKLLRILQYALLNYGFALYIIQNDFIGSGTLSTLPLARIICPIHFEIISAASSLSQRLPPTFAYHQTTPKINQI